MQALGYMPSHANSVSIKEVEREVLVETYEGARAKTLAAYLDEMNEAYEAVRDDRPKDLSRVMCDDSLSKDGNTHDHGAEQNLGEGHGGKQTVAMFSDKERRRDANSLARHVQLKSTQGNTRNLTYDGLDGVDRTLNRARLVSGPLLH